MKKYLFLMIFFIGLQFHIVNASPVLTTGGGQGTYNYLYANGVLIAKNWNGYNPGSAIYTKEAYGANNNWYDITWTQTIRNAGINQDETWNLLYNSTTGITYNKGISPTNLPGYSCPGECLSTYWGPGYGAESIPQLTSNYSNSCTNGIQDLDETGIDIGGICGLPASCTDGIKNQDETGIDVGGVCGNNTFNYSGTEAKGANVQCSTNTYNVPSTITWYTDYGSLTPAVWEGASSVEGGLGFQDTASGGLDTDYFRGIYYASGSYVPHEVMQWGGSSPVANVEYLPERVTPLSSKDPRVKVVRKRAGILSEFNVMQLSYNSSENAGGYAEFGTYNGNGGSPIPYTGVYRPCVMNGDNTCTIVANKMAKYADLHFYSGLTGLRFGKSTNTANKVVCKNDDYSCKWTYSSTASGGFVCNGITLQQDGTFKEGDCGISSEGYCIPTSQWHNPSAYEHPVLDSSGNVIGIAPGATEGDTSASAMITDEIFSCPQYIDWTDSVQCVIQVFKNAYSVTKKAINTTTSDSEKTVVGNLKSIGSSGSTVNFGAFSTGGVNLADNIYRGAWDKAFDKNESLTGFSRAGFYGALMMLIFTIALGMYFISSRK